MGAYLANNVVLKAALAGTAAGWLMSGHANDYLAGVAFLAYTNLLFDAVRPSHRIVRPLTCGAYILGCGLVWEYVVPLLIAHSISDPWDLLAYLLGGMTYWLIERKAQGGWWPGNPARQRKASQAWTRRPRRMHDLVPSNHPR
ncbi:MAG: hypothetical protein PHR15_01360 [Atopobiaceae bacterium]|jgi:hypothetical protein|nr:hypothetical protein [Atopobiaceae bacterium]MCH4214818.1 hypothetical protein [Atopobiaceae bacterium]MCH4230238.1 hypothetical protein [Atopobiaceae bacterium]MCH4276794.1 hypothetical protein [Atopobiaceae bacterium]MCI1226139.1 hypothetical protein [Atopobiaceae bacterium]